MRTLVRADLIDDEEHGEVVAIAEHILRDLGWSPVSRVSWDTRDEDCLFRRGNQVLFVRHHPARRELSVTEEPHTERAHRLVHDWLLHWLQRLPGVR